MRKLAALSLCLMTPAAVNAQQAAKEGEGAQPSAQASAQASSSSSTSASSASAQLRHVVGTWDVTTEFLRDDGSTAGSFEGTYAFQWVVPGKVVSGVTTMPAINQTAAMMFYHRPSTGEIEMVSVGQDGQLWVMTGSDTSEVRETPVVAMGDGSTITLRFTRFNVMADSFESRMERSSDGGKTWLPGNHQLFRRAGVSDGK